MATWYAWSQINNGSSDVTDGKSTGTVTVIRPGDTVSEGDFSSPEEFAALIATGSVRQTEYPDMGVTANPESPVDYLRRQAREAAEVMDPSQMATGVAVSPEAMRQPEPQED